MLVAKDKSSFNFEEFKNQAIADMKAGKSLVGKDYDDPHNLDQ